MLMLMLLMMMLMLMLMIVVVVVATYVGDIGKRSSVQLEAYSEG